METTPNRTLQALSKKENITKKDLQDLVLVAAPMIFNVISFLPDELRDGYVELSEVMARCYIHCK